MGEVRAPGDVCVHNRPHLSRAVLGHKLDLPQHVARTVNQPVIALDVEPLLVVDTDDEKDNKPQVFKVTAFEPMVPGPQIQEPV